MAMKLGITDIVSAGFVEIVNGEIECYGESVSLGIKSHYKKDAIWISKSIVTDF